MSESEAQMVRVETLREAANALELEADVKRRRRLETGGSVEDIREDRLIWLGISEAAHILRTSAAALERSPS